MNDKDKDSIRKAVEAEFNLKMGKGNNLGGSIGIPDLDDIDGVAIIKVGSIDELEQQLKAAGVPNAEEFVKTVKEETEIIDLLKKIGLAYNRTPYGLAKVISTFNNNAYAMQRANDLGLNPADVVGELLSKGAALLGALIDTNRHEGKPFDDDDIMAQLLIAVDLLTRKIEDNKGSSKQSSQSKPKTFKDVIEDLLKKNKGL